MTLLDSIMYYTERRKQNRDLRLGFEKQKLIIEMQEEALFEYKQAVGL